MEGGDSSGISEKDGERKFTLSLGETPQRALAIEEAHPPAPRKASTRNVDQSFSSLKMVYSIIKLICISIIKKLRGDLIGRNNRKNREDEFNWVPE